VTVKWSLTVREWTDLLVSCRQLDTSGSDNMDNVYAGSCLWCIPGSPHTSTPFCSVQSAWRNLQQWPVVIVEIDKMWHEVGGQHPCQPPSRHECSINFSYECWSRSNVQWCISLSIKLSNVTNITAQCDEVFEKSLHLYWRPPSLKMAAPKARKFQKWFTWNPCPI